MQNNSTIKSLEQAIKSFFADSKSSRRYNLPINQKDIEDLAQTLISEFEIKENLSNPISSATLAMIDESIANDMKGIRGREFDPSKFKGLLEENPSETA